MAQWASNLALLVSSGLKFTDCAGFAIRVHFIRLAILEFYYSNSTGGVVVPRLTRDNFLIIIFHKMSTVAPEVESEDGMHSNSRSYGSTKNLTASENNDKNGGGAATPAYHNEVRQKTPRRNGWQRPWNAMLVSGLVLE